MFSAYPFPLWWLREYIYTLSYYHHQIGSANYYPLFRVRSWSNGVRCMSCYILTKCLGYQFYLKPLMFHTPTSHKWNCIYIFRDSVCRTISIETSKSAVHGDFVPKRPSVVFEKKIHLFSISIFSWHTLCSKLVCVARLPWIPNHVNTRPPWYEATEVSNSGSLRNKCFLTKRSHRAFSK